MRAYDYGLRPADTTPPPLLVAQIETAAAVAEAGAIAEIDGIDVLFVGPADLERNLAGQPAGRCPDFETCVSRVATAARAAGKAAGILMRNPAELPLRQRQGFSLVAIQSDVALLRDAFPPSSPRPGPADRRMRRRFLPDCLGESHGPGGRGVSFCVPGAWWQYPG